MREHFYHRTTRSYIVAFASLFDDLYCTTDSGNQTPVPLHYAPKQKFLAILEGDYDKDVSDIETTLPRIAFEMTGLNYAPERHLNPSQTISTGSDAVMHNRLPYDFSFTLFFATKQFDDSLEIMEQIVPMFSPDFNVTVKENVDGIALRTNLSVVLNSASFNIEYEGSFDTMRRIEWTLTFTLKGFLYPHVRQVQRIKKAFVHAFEMGDKPIPFFTSIAEVVPSAASQSDPHVIVETVINE